MIPDRLFSDVSPEIARILDAALDGRELSPADAAVLLRAEGVDLFALMRAGDVARFFDGQSRRRLWHDALLGLDIIMYFYLYAYGGLWKSDTCNRNYSIK